MKFYIEFYIYLRIALQPTTNRPGAIIFTLTAAQLIMEVMVTDKGITLNSLQGGSSNPSMLSNVIGTTVKLDDLIKLLRDSACDIFPEDDSFCYTESSCEKNYVMEMHIYSCMASFALSVNFSWSRWNFAAGSRTCVFLMRELLEMRKLVNIEYLIPLASWLQLSNPLSRINPTSTLRPSRPASSTVPKCHRPFVQPPCPAITTPTLIISLCRLFSPFRRHEATRWVRYCDKIFFSFWSPSDRWAFAKQTWRSPLIPRRRLDLIIITSAVVCHN